MKNIICIVCPRGCHLSVDEERDFAVAGNACPRGEDYGRAEMQNPTRVLTSTVRLCGGELGHCPVRTSGAIPKALLFDAMRELELVCLNAPVSAGQVVIADILGTGCDLIVTRSIGAEDGAARRE